MKNKLLNVLAKLRYSKFEVAFIALLLVISGIPRLTNLGYSHFYGDETKVLYLDKTVSAKEFFFNQRKGPMQFFVAWVMESVTGGYSEFWLRLPFALAGLMAVVVLYFVVKEAVGAKEAVVASLLFASNGFFVAFSRTVQYQSLLFLFGFLGLYFFLLHTKKPSKWLLYASAVSYAVAFLSHYDAIFFAIPVLFLIPKKDKQKVKHLAIHFLLPLVALVSAFYVPYFIKGYFSSTAQNYIFRRLVGEGQALPNNSMYTNEVYNPFLMYSMLLIIGLCLVTTHLKDIRTHPFLVWFIVALLTFGYAFKNPGTHIINFIIPAMVLAASSLVTSINNASSGAKKYLLNFFVALVILVQFIHVYYIFIPSSKAEYPWAQSKLGLLTYPPVTKKSQLFLYGFPYNRNWQRVSDELHDLGARGFFTNDDDDIAQYYVKNIDYTRVGTNFYPAYYVEVENNMLLQVPSPEFLAHYALVSEFNSDEFYTRIYRFAK